MALPNTMRSAVSRKLRSLDFSPWHDCWGVGVWRQPTDQWEFSFGSQIVNEPVVGLDAAVEFVMRHGWL